MLSTVSIQLCKLRKEYKSLRHLIKRRKSRTHSRRTTFHTVISSRKANLQSKGCQTDKIASTNEDPALGMECPSPMDEDLTNCNSPLISQYGAHQYGRTQQSSPVHRSTAHMNPSPEDTDHSHPLHRSTEHTEVEHKSSDQNGVEHKNPDHTLPVHMTPEHNETEHNEAVHTTPVHNSPAQRGFMMVTGLTLPALNSPEHTTPLRSSPLAVSPSPTPPWLYTPESPPRIYKSTIYNAADHPNSPPFHHLLNQGLEIFEPISPEAASSENPPRYDTSTRKDDQPALLKVTPDTSPTKSSGFADHASTVNAFAATATSRRISIPVINFDQSQVIIFFVCSAFLGVNCSGIVHIFDIISAQEDISPEDCTELSDSSPAKPTPRHQPSEEECDLATELFKCPSVPALTILSPLPQTMWELFSSTLQTKKDVFHITPSKFDFSNKFLLDIAEPQKWLSTFGFNYNKKRFTALYIETSPLQTESTPPPSMTSSSTSSSRPSSRRSVHGVPTKCWCGKGLQIWASETKENPFRRFYRCEVVLQRKSESHLFKWEDEAILDEVRMVDAKVMDLVHDYQALSKIVADQLHEHKSDCEHKLKQHMSEMKQQMLDAKTQMIEEFHSAFGSNMEATQIGVTSTTNNFVAVVAIVGAMACIYWKLF
ncbi:unnamed protein product [Eruca vesicaria subsp. sativa]|uniref:GRF-type domain-containing protein n=1 Tax=Eruca vesicaria subsp. sativa TaxID=29727 RepID=A0ABC8L7V9_ERUVS|nr:unnamed protein product [Eruca vesicaria subsp. sativa]